MINATLKKKHTNTKIIIAKRPNHKTQYQTLIKQTSFILEWRRDNMQSLIETWN